MPVAAPEPLSSLRRLMAAAAPRGGEPARLMALGHAGPDGALGGGLMRGALHELAPAAPLHLGAATGFALAVAALAAAARRQVLWVQPDHAVWEAGALYGHGLDQLGLPMRALALLRVAKPRDGLWAMEEALKCRAVAAVILELGDDAIDLTASRRLALAAGTGEAIGLILRHRPTAAPGATATRWEIAAAPGPRDTFGGLGPTAFALSLTKNRRGPTGRWHLVWNHHDRAFVPASPSLAVAPATADRPARARLG